MAAKITIYSKLNVAKVDAYNFTYSGNHMGERKLSVEIESPTPITFAIGDYANLDLTYSNEKFYLHSIPIGNRVHNSLMIKYNLVFWWIGYELKTIAFLDYVEGTESADAYNRNTGEVVVNGTIVQLMDRIKANMGRAFAGGWYDEWNYSIHASVDTTPTKEIILTNQYCWDALQLVNSLFGIEYRIDLDARVILVGYPPSDITVETGITFEYGKDKGLCEITRLENTEQLVTRVFAYGSTRNITPTYRAGLFGHGYSPRLMLPLAEAPDGYLANTVLEALYGIREAFYINDDIYPTITELENDLKKVDVVIDRPEVETPQYETVVVTPGYSKRISDGVGDFYGRPENVIITVQGTGSVVTTIPHGTYVVTAFNDDGEGLPTAIGTIEILDDTPAGFEGVVVSWDAVTGAAGYKIYEVATEMYYETASALWDYYTQVPATAGTIPVEGYIYVPAVTKQVLIPTANYNTFTVYISGTLPDINDENLQSGSTAKISFITGLLTGNDFEIVSYEKYMTDIAGVPTWDDGLGNQYYKVVLKRINNDDNYVLPNSTITPAVGDEFVFLDIYLPSEYEAAAELALYNDTVAWLAQHSGTPLAYAIRMPEEFIARDVTGLEFYLHESVLAEITDTILGVDAKYLIQAITIDYKSEQLLPTYNLTLSDKPIQGKIQQLEAALKNANYIINANNSITNKQIENILKSTYITNNRIFNSNGDINGDIISPYSILPIAFGTDLRSTRFILTAYLQVNYGGDANSAYGSAGVLIHKDVDIVWGSVFDLEHQTWTIATPQTFTSLDPDKYYYVYVKGSLTDGTAIWVLSETPIGAESVEGYLMFEWGQILPVVSGIRYTQYIYGGSDLSTIIPLTVDSSTVNETDGDSHTHALGTIDISSVFKAGGYGALYKFAVGTDVRNISSSDTWIVPTQTNWEDLLNSIDTYEITNPHWPLAGGKLKETGTLHWDYPNIGATDEIKFSAIGGGIRQDDGAFAGLKTEAYYWSATESLGATWFISMPFNDTWVNSSDAGTLVSGHSMRLCNPTTTNPEGFIGTYTQNNGQVIPTIVIGGVEWTANLNETQYRNADWITGYDGGIYTPISNEDWAALETEAMCYWGDIEEYGNTGIPLTNLLQQSSFQMLVAKDIEAGTAQDYDLILYCVDDITINSIVVECDDGTLTSCSVTIDATSVEIESAATFDVSATLTLLAATDTNLAVVGSRVKIHTSTGYTGTPTVISVQLNYSLT